MKMTCKDRFEATFKQWLVRALENGLPQSVKAFSFNLFEGGRAKFGVEIIGASEFDPTNQDWACEEIWEPLDRKLDIPVSFSGDTWEECLSAVQSLIRNMLEIDDEVSRILKSRKGIGVGFVDGDLHIVS